MTGYDLLLYRHCRLVHFSSVTDISLCGVIFFSLVSGSFLSSLMRFHVTFVRFFLNLFRMLDRFPIPISLHLNYSIFHVRSLRFMCPNHSNSHVPMKKIVSVLKMYCTFIYRKRRLSPCTTRLLRCNDRTMWMKQGSSTCNYFSCLSSNR